MLTYGKLLFTRDLISISISIACLNFRLFSQFTEYDLNNFFRLLLRFLSLEFYDFFFLSFPYKNNFFLCIFNTYCVFNIKFQKYFWLFWRFKHSLHLLLWRVAFNFYHCFTILLQFSWKDFLSFQFSLFKKNFYSEREKYANHFERKSWREWCSMFLCISETCGCMRLRHGAGSERYIGIGDAICFKTLLQCTKKIIQHYNLLCNN